MYLKIFNLLVFRTYEAFKKQTEPWNPWVVQKTLKILKTKEPLNINVLMDMAVHIGKEK